VARWPTGNYTLTLRDRVYDSQKRAALDGDGDGQAGGDRDTFFRFYGDSDGDATSR
jgi:hypothetical protein